ncbi:MAG: sodium:solute symporter family transporter [Persicimonas sp.]
MRYIDLIADNPLVWGLFLLYLVGTMGLAWMGHKKTDDMASFALGKGDMHPVVVGVTLAASIASVATFVINPGFVYVHGVSALMHYGVAAGLGIFTALIVLSIGFLRVGKATKALTLPQWVGQRYGSKTMEVLFAGVNLLSITFMVLIVGGLSLVMQKTLGLTNVEALVLIIGFVFSYIFLGGTYAHAYTNTLQGVLMFIVGALVVFSGLHFFGDGIAPVVETLAASDPNLVKTANPDSTLFGTPFVVWVCGYVIGFALVCQPHIIIKPLYLDSEKEVWQSIGVCLAVSVIFTALLLVGIYAHMMEIPPEAFMGANGEFKQDLVMTVYLTETFSPSVLAFVMVVLLAAGMSTLDGILVALSSIAGNDLFLNLTKNNLLADKTEEEQSKLAHHVSQGVLVAMGVVTFLIALHPPELLGIFGQIGVYAIVTTCAVPISFGIFFPRLTKWTMLPAAVLALAVYLGLTGWYYWAIFSDPVVDLNAVVADWSPVALLFDTGAAQLGFGNPAVPAVYGIFASVVVAVVGIVVGRVGRG